jgi:hypothetical protein
MWKSKSLLQDGYIPPRTGPAVSFCTNAKAKFFDYELRLREQCLMRGSMRANSEKDLIRMLENRHPAQITELRVLRSYRAKKA